MERLLEDISFDGAEYKSAATQTVTIDAEFVIAQLAGLAADDDLSRYIL
jgi:ATP-dependent HslUV protease ATP-binding subunit HslU